MSLLSDYILAFDRLPDKVIEGVKCLEVSTEKCTGFLLNVCMSYGSRAEIVSAFKDVATDAAAGRITVDEIDESFLSNRLLTKDIPGKYLLP